MSRRCVAAVGALLVVAGVTTFARPVQAGVASKAVREAAEYVFKKFGLKMAKEGAEALAARLDNMVAKYGDEVLTAAKKVGPRGLDAIDEAGPLGPTAVKYLAKYGDEALGMVGKPQALRLASEFGDEAVRAMIKHPGVAEGLIAKYGNKAARALGKLDQQQARRLVMMERSGELSRIGRTDELLDVIGRYGDRAMKFVWKHKGALAVSTILATFLANPEPYINGLKDLAKEAVQGLTDVTKEGIKSAGDVAGKVAVEAARGTNWTVVFLAVVVVVTTLIGVRWLLKWKLAQSPKT